MMFFDLSIDNICIIFCEFCEYFEMYCDYCNVNMCLVCVGKYLLDFLILYNIVLFVNCGSILKYLFCRDYSDKICEFYC